MKSIREKSARVYAMGYVGRLEKGDFFFFFFCVFSTVDDHLLWYSKKANMILERRCKAFQTSRPISIKGFP